MLSSKFIISIFLFFLLFLGYFHPIASITQDLGRHLLTGGIILQDFAVPKTNLFSYAYPDFPFINHHWGSEVVFYLVFKFFGFNGLFILNTALILSAFGLIIGFIYKKVKGLTILFCSLLYIPILFERTDVRPEFFSFLFLSLFLVILYKAREKFTPLIFLLPVIELFWVNMHIYFPIGIAVIGLFLIEAIISYVKNPNTKILNPKQIQITKIQNLKHFDHLKIRVLNIVSNFDIRISSLLFILFVSILVTFLNPNGLNGALYPFRFFQNYGYSIEENQNIFFLWSLFHKQSILFFFITAPILFASLILNFKRVSFIEWLISIFFTIFTILSIRNFPLFALATLIPLAKSFSNLKLSLPKYLKAVFVIFLLGLSIFEAQQIYARKGFGVGVEIGARDAADFFIKEKLKGPIFNNFDIGSYLDYRLYPKEKVFVDGRPEAYPASFFKEEYMPMQENQVIFEKEDQRYNFNTIFFSHTDQTPWAEKFLKQISQNEKWNLVYLDSFAAIWTKTNNVKPNIQTNYSDMQSLIQLAHFFQNTTFTDEEIKIYQKILSINPDHCPGLYNLALKLQDKNDPSSSIFLTKFQQNCQ